MLAIAMNDLDGGVFAVEKPKYMKTLEFMQALVDGLISIVPTRSDLPLDLFVNDEGMFRDDFRYNFRASVLAGQGLVGPAFLIGCDKYGETVGVTADDLDEFGSPDVISLQTYLDMRTLIAMEDAEDDEEDIDV